MSDYLTTKVHGEREFFEFDKERLDLLLGAAVSAHRSAVKDLRLYMEKAAPLQRIIMLDRECDARSADITRIIGMIEAGGRWA